MTTSLQTKNRAKSDLSQHENHSDLDISRRRFPGVEPDKSGDRPKSEPAEQNPAFQEETKTIYTCPMHPEIRRDQPGSCPICGMTLEPVAGEPKEENSEAKDMTRRFWVATIL